MARASLIASLPLNSFDRGRADNSGNVTHLSSVVDVVRVRIGRESVAKVGRSPASSAKMLSLVFGQRFRNRKWLGPRPDQVASLRFERVGLGIPSRPLAVGDVYLVQTPKKVRKEV